MDEKLWTVARFPSGAWSFGGKPDDPAYSECEIWQIPATTGKGWCVRSLAREGGLGTQGAIRRACFWG